MATDIDRPGPALDDVRETLADVAITGDFTSSDRTDLELTEFADETVRKAISKAEVIIETRLPDPEYERAVGTEWAEDAYEHAVTETAAYLTYTASPGEMRDGVLDLATTYDAQTYVNRLKERRDDALALIGLQYSDGRRSAPFATSTDGFFGTTYSDANRR